METINAWIIVVATALSLASAIIGALLRSGLVGKTEAAKLNRYLELGGKAADFLINSPLTAREVVKRTDIPRIQDIDDIWKRH